MTFESLFAVKTADIKKASAAAIEYIIDKRKRFYEDAIQREMNRRFFRAKTREQAENRLLGAEPFPDWDCWAWGSMAQAENLRDASNASCADVAHLSAEDASFVEKWK